jgi:hypothetical protein
MLKINVDTSSAAFDDGACEEELTRILRQVAIYAAAGVDGAPILDSNGNTVGRWTYK